MKWIRKNAKYVGYLKYNDEKLHEWQCPNKKCGMHVTEEYDCCPYCSQKLKFNLTEHSKDLISVEFKFSK